MSRGDLSEAVSRLLTDLPPTEPSRKSQPTRDYRTIVNGILWRIRADASWCNCQRSMAGG